MELGNANFTIALWLKTSSARVAILSKGDITDQTFGPGEKLLYLDENGKVRYVGFGVGSISGNTAVNNNAWHHIAVTFASSGNLRKVYVDGQDDTDLPNTTYVATPDTAGDRFLLGYDPSTEARHFNGVLDEVAVWARALSASDVADIHTAGRQGSGLDTLGQLPSDLLFHATMDVFLGPAPDGQTKYKRGFEMLQP
jgi:hypothetical protein